MDGFTRLTWPAVAGALLPRKEKERNAQQVSEMIHGIILIDGDDSMMLPRVE